MVPGDPTERPCHLPNLQSCSEEDSGRAEEAHVQLQAGEKVNCQLSVLLYQSCSYSDCWSTWWRLHFDQYLNSSYGSHMLLESLQHHPLILVLTLLGVSIPQVTFRSILHLNIAFLLACSLCTISI